MRESGVLLPISSLPGRYGIGSLGKEAKSFAGRLARSGCKVWQILPINPTSFGDSPYQSFCTFAGNVYFIDLDELVSQGLLKKSDLPNYEELSVVDYGKLYHERYETLEKAFDYSYNKICDKVEEFSAENPWLNDFALFMSLKEKFGGASWQDFPKELKFRKEKALEKAREELKDRINFYKFTQYLFSSMWVSFKKYVNSLGIKLMGDIPIYVALDSSDVWANPKAFMLDDSLTPTVVAGVPPDYFCEDGQLWGNPIYDIEYLKKTDYKFWTDRIGKAAEYYDVIRLDHFIGFANYYSVPYGEKTARNGKWNDGMGEELFRAIRKKVGNVEIIAEDLGVLSDKVVALRDKLNLPGMKVLQFSLEENGFPTPESFPENSVIYTGTHDNDTTKGWYLTLGESEKTKIRRLFNINSALSDEDSANAVVDKMIRLCFSAKSRLAIVPLQDLLRLGSDSRMNSPGLDRGNWQFRLCKSELTPSVFSRLKRLNNRYSRNGN